MYIREVQKDLVDLSKHYIHEIDALVSLDRTECFALEKKNMQKNSYIVVGNSLVYEASVSVGFKCTKQIVCRVIYAHAADLMHVLLTCLFTNTHCYIPDDIVGRPLLVHYPQNIKSV